MSPTEDLANGFASGLNATLLDGSSYVETGDSQKSAVLKTQNFRRWPRTCLGVRRDYVSQQKGADMLYYALVFLLIAAVAGVLGFGVVAFAAAGIAKILFFIFLVLFLVSLISHLSRTSVP
jgi:uncharacterized membrane protein YtjA (UPF0391 family)